MTVDHNLIDGYTDVSGEAAVTGDPRFVSVSAPDFHLQDRSPAIDAGTPTDAPAVDLEGVVRPQGSAPDIGAYEWHENAAPAAPTGLNVLAL